MMAKNIKTPVMILQELAVKRNTTPEYDLIYSQQGTHENIFHYKVSLLNEQAIGIGRSKKEAKHEAASKALELLAERGIFHPDMSTECIAKGDIGQEHVQTKAPLNCIPTLLDMCVENKIPLPEFVEISAVGPPHCREFTYECHIAKITTRATAGSKKHAKQMAAKEMLNRVINIIPELQQETSQLMITSDDNEVIDKFTSMSKFSSSKVNYNSKVIEYDMQFKTLMNDLCVKAETVMKILDKPPSEETLAHLLQQFDLKFELHILQEEPPMVVIFVNSDTPVTVIETASNIKKASTLAIVKMFEILKAFLI